MFVARAQCDLYLGIQLFTPIHRLPDISFTFRVQDSIHKVPSNFSVHFIGSITTAPYILFTGLELTELRRVRDLFTQNSTLFLYSPTRTEMPKTLGRILARTARDPKTEQISSQPRGLGVYGSHTSPDVSKLE